MPVRPAIELLPDNIRSQLNRELESRGFADYGALSAWLGEQGFEISRSALHRYGQKFEDRCRAIRLATQQAQAIVEASPDEGGAMNDALTRLVQEKLFGVLVDLEGDDIVDALPAIGRTVAELGKASVVQKKWAVEVRNKAEKTAEVVSKTLKTAGLSSAAVDDIRKHILGIAG